ncbi:MAG TPA: prenyltransferase [Leptolyngbyaceae cyanobacterium M65_K2018_010]|nr:prenyltransferase [Leptolyngbyaceae cyanobacterium M65_K2018_010]
MAPFLTPNQLAKTLDYLASKQCANGGFCTYRMEYLEEPNPRDTFLAVASFQRVGEAVPHSERVYAYLEKILSDLKATFFSSLDSFAKAYSTTAFNYLYFPFATLKCLGKLQLDDFWQEVFANLKIRLPDQSHAYQSSLSRQLLLQKVRTQKLAGPVPDRQQIIDFTLSLKHHGSFGRNPNLLSTCWGLCLLNELDYDLSPMNDTRAYIQQLQAPQTGFILTTNGLLTNLEVVYAGILSSFLLQMDIPYLDAALRFVRMCQMDRGGFAPMPVGLPNIENTYRALTVFSLTAG